MRQSGYIYNICLWLVNHIEIQITYVCGNVIDNYIINFLFIYIVPNLFVNLIDFLHIIFVHI